MGLTTVQRNGAACDRLPAFHHNCRILGNIVVFHVLSEQFRLLPTTFPGNPKMQPMLCLTLYLPCLFYLCDIIITLLTVKRLLRCQLGLNRLISCRFIFVCLRSLITRNTVNITSLSFILVHHVGNIQIKHRHNADTEKKQKVDLPYACNNITQIYMVIHN